MALKGQKTSDETKLKQRLASLGRLKSAAHREAMSKGKNGTTLSENHRENISRGLRKAYKNGRVKWNFREDREQVKNEKRMARFLRNSLARCLSLSGTIKEDKTFEILGYTPKQLVENITSKLKDGMTWANYGFRGWHIDHIKSVAEFEIHDPKIVNSLDNLRPLWSTENFSKGASTKWTKRKTS